MIPQWAKRAGLDARQLRALIEPHQHIGYVLEHLMHYAELDSTFDVSFFNREPILEVRLARNGMSFWAHSLVMRALNRSRICSQT